MCWYLPSLSESYRCRGGGDSFAAALMCVSEWQQRQDGVCVNWKARGTDQQCVGLMGFTGWQLNRSFPHFNWQSNVTGPSNSYVVTGSVFGNLYEEKKILHPYMEKPLSSCLSSRLFVIFLPENQHLSPAAELSGSYIWMWVTMWCDSEQTFTHHVFVSFYYCFVEVTVSGNLYWKKST